MGCRQLREFDVRMNRDGMHHLAMQFRYSPYVKFARTQDEFNLLWVNEKFFKIPEIPVRFVRPSQAKGAFRHICWFNTRSESVAWALRLEWESLQQIRLKGLYHHVDNVVDAFSPAGLSIDPRKIVWLRDNHVDLYKLALRLISHKIECPELTMYLAIYGRGDLRAPTADEYAEVYLS